MIPFLTCIKMLVYSSIYITSYSAGEIELVTVQLQYCDASQHIDLEASHGGSWQYFVYGKINNIALPKITMVLYHNCNS